MYWDSWKCMDMYTNVMQWVEMCQMQQQQQQQQQFQTADDCGPGTHMLINSWSTLTKSWSTFATCWSTVDQLVAYVDQLSTSWSTSVKSWSTLWPTKSTSWSTVDQHVEHEFNMLINCCSTCWRNHRVDQLLINCWSTLEGRFLTSLPRRVDQLFANKLNGLIWPFNLLINCWSTSWTKIQQCWSTVDQLVELLIQHVDQLWLF